MRFSSSLFHRLVTGTILIFLFLRSANGIKCHSTDTNSINGTCESPRLCTVYVQLGEVFQQCKGLFSVCPNNNPNHIHINLESMIPYRFCCDYDWCNTIDKILPYISPSPSPTSSFGGQSSSLITSSVLSVWEAPPSTSTSSRISQIFSASNTFLVNTKSYTIAIVSPTSETPSASSSLRIYIIAITVLCVIIILFIVVLVTLIFFLPRQSSSRCRRCPPYRE